LSLTLIGTLLISLLGKVRKNEAQTENFHQISNKFIQFLGGYYLIAYTLKFVNPSWQLKKQRNEKNTVFYQ
jgi:hypothetical protein